MAAAAIYVGLILSTVYIYFYWFNTKTPSGLRFPPGPRRRLLIGNLLDLPRKKAWITFDRWAKEYGELVHLNVLGKSLLFVNSFELAQELFDKRGNIYSNRYETIVWGQMLQLNWLFTLMQYGEKWRRYRALFNQFFGLAVVENHEELQQNYIKVLLERLYQAPDKYREHIRFTIGAIVIELTYGIKVKSENDPFLALSEDTVTKLSEAGVPGAYMVDVIPILKHIPAWFPGAGFKRELAALRSQCAEMVNSPITVVKEAMNKGNAFSSIASLLIEQFTNDPNRPSDYEDLMKYVPGAAFMAGVDTTDCAALQFFFAMVLNPEVQKKAQDELDSVVGPDALPSLSDRGNLPYIQAILNETMRWNTALPAGLPHVLDQDDIIGEYFIPKGTIVFGNSWTLLRSTSVYGEDADKFRPERFINSGVPVPNFAFGYGRRVCPGRYFAENTLFLLIASVLHIFTILPFEGRDGPEYPEEDFKSGVLLQPKTFKCRIIPRSPAATKLLEEMHLSN